MVNRALIVFQMRSCLRGGVMTCRAPCPARAMGVAVAYVAVAGSIGFKRFYADRKKHCKKKHGDHQYDEASGHLD